MFQGKQASFDSHDMALEEPRTIRKITRANAKHRKRSEETLWNGGSSVPLSATTSDKKAYKTVESLTTVQLINQRKHSKNGKVSICFNDPKPASCVKTSEVAQMCSSLPRRSSCLDISVVHLSTLSLWSLAKIRHPAVHQGAMIGPQWGTNTKDTKQTSQVWVSTEMTAEKRRF